MSFLAWFIFVIVTIIIASLLNETFKYYAKFIFYMLTCFLVASLPAPLMLLRPFDSRNAKFPSWGAAQAIKVIGGRIQIRGKENIVNDRGSTIVMNHQSVLDISVIGELWPLIDNCAQVAKKSVFYIFPFGIACWLWGTIYIDRVNANSAKQEINKAEQAVKEKKVKLIMFPEGTRGEGDELLPFKKGAFHVAIGAQCPIQPIVISKYHFVKRKPTKSFGRGDVIVTILPAIPTAGLTKNDIDKLIEQTRNVMADCYQKASLETLNMSMKKIH